MHDVFLSYAHESAPLARDIYSAVLARGRSAWIDTPGSRSEADTEYARVGIPIGSPHWDTITAAIGHALTFVICDSSAWRVSAYCRRELEYAISLGIRVAVITDHGSDWPAAAGPVQTRLAARGYLTTASGRLGDLFAELSPGDEAAAAQERLLDALPKDGSADSSPRWWIGQERASDAETLLACDPDTPSLPRPNDEVRALAARILSAAAQRRRRIQRGATAAVLVFAVATVTALVALGISTTQRNLETARANDSASLDLANRALRASTSERATQLANQALARSDTTAAREAHRVASATWGITSLSVPEHAYTAAAINDDASMVLLSTLKDGFLFQPLHGEHEPARRAAPAMHTLTFDRTGHRAIGISPPGTGPAWNIDADAHTLTPIGGPGATAAAVGGDGTVWIGYRDGWLRQASLTDGTVTDVRDMGEPIRALTVSETELTLLTGQDHLQRFQLPLGADTAPLWSVSLAEQQATAPPGLLEDLDAQLSQSSLDPAAVPEVAGRDSLRTCGRHTTVVLHTSRKPVSDLVMRVDDTGHLMGPVTSTTAVHGMVCTSDGATMFGGYAKNPASEPGTTHLPVPDGLIDQRDRFSVVPLGVSPSGRWIAAAHEDGRLQVTEADQGRLVYGAGRATHNFPVSGGSIRVRDDKAVVWVGDNGEERVLADTQDWVAAEPLDTGLILSTATDVRYLSATASPRSWPIAGDNRLEPSRTGRQILVLGEQCFVLEPSTGSQTLCTWPDLNEDERLFQARLDGDRVVVSTTAGRLVASDLNTGRILTSFSTDVEGPFPVEFGPNGSYITHGSDGVLRRHGPDLAPISSVFLGTRPSALTTSADYVALLTSDEDITLRDIDTLELVAVASRDWQGSTPRFDPSGEHLWYEVRAETTVFAFHRLNLATLPTNR